MVNKEKEETKLGLVTEALPNTEFRVLLQDENDKEEDFEEKEVIAYLSGKMKKYRIRVLVGDEVRMVMDKYGGKPRIVERL